MRHAYITILELAYGPISSLFPAKFIKDDPECGPGSFSHLLL